MNFQVQRDGQFYGPYTRQDLERYLASGNVLPTDLAKSEDMPDWLPVSQIIGMATPPPPPAFGVTEYGQQAYPAVAPVDASVYPDPPSLHWGLVLLFSALTCGLFGYIWDIVQSNWMRKVQPRSKAFFYYLGSIVVLIPYWGVAFMDGVRHQSSDSANIFLLPQVVLLLVGRFSLRNSLEEHFNTAEPVGLTLSGVMTFFFGTLYFQYHMTRIAEMKRAARASVGRGY